AKKGITACEPYHKAKATCKTDSSTKSVAISKVIAMASSFVGRNESSSASSKVEIRRPHVKVDFPPNWDDIKTKQREYQVLKEKSLLDVHILVQQHSRKIDMVEMKLNESQEATQNKVDAVPMTFSRLQQENVRVEALGYDAMMCWKCVLYYS
ncbi:hypothetical protein CDV36_015957, partial [Fusarium kuroshium]